MSTPDKSPSSLFSVLPVDAWMKDDNEQKQLLMDVASHIVFILMRNFKLGIIILGIQGFNQRGGWRSGYEGVEIFFLLFKVSG